MPEEGKKNVRTCLGYPLGVVLMLWHSLTLGVDYTIWISTAPAYFSDILNHSGDYATNDSATLTDDATAGFSVAQSVWAAGQLLGCMASAPLPRLMGYRWAFIMLVFLSVTGNVMYSVAGIIGNDGDNTGGEWLAWIGKAIDGFGDGSVALGLGYVPIAMFHDKKRMRTAMINYRALMAGGMMLGAAICIGLENVAITQAVGSDGVAREFSGGDLVGWAQAVVFTPSLFFACCALDDGKPPVAKGKGGKKGAICTPYFTQKSCFWLFLVFSYGLTGSLATYFLPVFPYCPGYCNDMASQATDTLAEYINYVTLGAFAAGFAGAMFNSTVSVMKRCNINGLPLLRASCILITAAMSFMYAGYRVFDTEASEVGTGQILFIVGICLYFLASTSLSAGMAPVFKEVIPKTSLSCMMPLYKICLDGGKIIGPLYSDWASTDSYTDPDDTVGARETRADIAFIPSLAMYILITVVIFIGGKYLSTPDFKAPSSAATTMLNSKEGSEKSAEMTAVAGPSHSNTRSTANTYENQRGDGGSAPAKSRSASNASSTGYSLYSGTSMSYSQIADAKNIDSVKVSLVI